MRLRPVSALALVVGLTSAYTDVSPFFMFSTAELESESSIGDPSPLPQLQSAAALSSRIVDTLSKCPTDLYLIVSQPGVRPDDYRTDLSSKQNPAFIHDRMTHSSSYGIRTSQSVKEVIGSIDISSFHAVLKERCGVRVHEIDMDSTLFPVIYDHVPRLYHLHLPAPGQGETRRSDVSANDAFFGTVMNLIPSYNYTVIYVTSAGELTRRVSDSDAGLYEMESEIQEALHMDLKRDIGEDGMQKRDNQTVVDGGLFARYQFFTPGLFMGLVVGLLLLMIVYVGISALSSLQVTYAAFDKESGFKSQ